MTKLLLAWVEIDSSCKGAGDNNVQGGFVGGSLRLHATNNLRGIVDVKYRGAGGRESEFIGRAGISYNF